MVAYDICCQFCFHTTCFGPLKFTYLNFKRQLSNVVRFNVLILTQNQIILVQHQAIFITELRYQSKALQRDVFKLADYCRLSKASPAMIDHFYHRQY